MAEFLSNALERPDGDFRLSNGDVHVWLISNAIEAAAFDDLLSPDEASVAQRLTGLNRARFKHRRGALRVILGRYLAREPASIAFGVGPHGKPHVAHGAVEFSLSHSSDVVTIAVALDVKLGIDVERLRRIDDSAGIADKFFDRREINVLAKTPPRAADRVFLNIWTRKEATLKAAGVGIADGLGIAVPTQDEVQGDEVQLELATGVYRYHLYSLALGPRIVGALASSHPGISIAYRALGN